jgi:hypothetical protein
MVFEKTNYRLQKKSKQRKSKRNETGEKRMMKMKNKEGF